MKRLVVCLSAFSVLVLLFGASPSVLAQPPGPGEGGFRGGGEFGGGKIIIAKLNRALGENPLSVDQEQDILAIVAEHREETSPPEPRGSGISLYKEYTAAILNSGEGLDDAVANIADATATRTAAHLLNQADLQIQLLQYLRDQGILTTLQEAGFEDQRILRLLSGRGRMGRGGKPGPGAESFSRERMGVRPSRQ